MRPIGYILTLVVALFAGGVAAQEQPSPVLTVDLERIARESDYGQRVNGLIQAESVTLQADFDRIEAALTAEEQALVTKRDTVSAEDFKLLSQAFDEKVVRLREEQAQKQSDLQERQISEQRKLLRTIAPILYEIVKDRGASVLIDRRNIVLDLSSVDITDDAIAAMNATLGDGDTPPATTDPVTPVDQTGANTND